MDKLIIMGRKIMPYFAIGLFICWTWAMILNGIATPGEAEAHAWTIAGNTTIAQLIQLMNVEGHFLLWFLSIMPFAKHPSLYPFAMYFVNWSFCFLAICILWKYAPFNGFTKICITFSIPFLQIFAVYPRCYSIGILFLFIAAALYKERLNKPYLYLITLTLAANTSLQACVAAFVLGILFLFDILKTKNDQNVLSFILGLFLFNFILFYYQFHGVSIPDYEADKAIKAPVYILAYLGQVQGLQPLAQFKIVLLWIGTLVFPIAFWKNKPALIFFIVTELFSLIFFSTVYGARPYHTSFMFVYVIISYWILWCENEQGKSGRFKWKSLAFGLLAFGMFFLNVVHRPSLYNEIKDVILNDEVLLNSKIYSNAEPITLSVDLPYLAQKGKTIYDMQGRDLNSYEALKTYYSKSGKYLDVDVFGDVINPNERNFILLNGMFNVRRIIGKNIQFDVNYYRGFQDTRTYNLYEVTNIIKNH